MVTKLFEAGLEKIGFLVHKSPSSGECYVPHNFVHLATLRETRVCQIVQLVVDQMKHVMER